MFNRQNTHWALENSTCSADIRHQMRFSINIWCGIFNNRLIGPVFFHSKLTSARYLELLLDVIPDFVENLPLFQLRNVWFQHDGAPEHKTSSVKQNLVEELTEQIIGYGVSKSDLHVHLI
ncbi:hypothetical protein AVEN_96002-1 [Araneus ventricosus]|uniref:Tc1-like transposase DDE domain-containing protein n=1 Tax=Araneus ventricosus TaxID=182803 RepID=A0A4Y2B432_ARAVE|nr:hypothetical protein AVEN_96002-1 [Araneus ventricosus]